jgi:hypothetical protein
MSGRLTPFLQSHGLTKLGCATALVLLALALHSAAARARPTTKTKLRLLLTDILFPNSFAAWRLNEIKAFQEHFKLDILVLDRVNTLGDGATRIPAGFDWLELRQSHALDLYDLLIFNPLYNYAQRYNSPDFNGTLFNGALQGADYMLRLKEFREEGKVAFMNYKAVYHIFLYLYNHFNARFPAAFPPHAQMIHLYPGGGFSADMDVEAAQIHPAAHLVITQPFTRDFCLRHNLSNPRIDVFGAQFVPQGFVRVAKRRKAASEELVGCFTSLGGFKAKGAHLYVKFVEEFQEKYPEDQIRFVGVGATLPSPRIISVAALAQDELSGFYRDEVDVIFNFDTTKNVNGWPLGSEAMVEGALLFTTDLDSMRERTGYGYREEVETLNCTAADSCDFASSIERLHTIVNDRRLLAKLSIVSQTKTVKLFDFRATTRKILRHMDLMVIANRTL